MDNLIKIIFIVLVAFMLLNYSCSNKEGFVNKKKEKSKKKN